MQMDKQKAVLGPLSVDYEPCLRCVGLMTKVLLNFIFCKKKKKSLNSAR